VFAVDKSARPGTKLAALSAPLLLWWPLVFGQSLLAPSTQDCPKPAAVDARVRQILGLSANAVLAEQATVERDDSSLHVTLRSPDGHVLGDRSLRADGSCSELVGVVAVVLAAWLSDVHPEFVGALPAAPPPPSPPPSPPPPATPLSSSPPSHHGALGLALGADLAGKNLAPLGALAFDWLPTRGGLGAFASASATGLHREALSTGSVQYWRWPLRLGAVLRLPLAGSALDVKAGPALGWLRLNGSGFATSSSSSALIGGGFISTRIVMTAQSFEPYAELGGVLFGSTRAFVQRGSDQVTVDLPSLELFFAIGASVRVW